MKPFSTIVAVIGLAWSAIVLPALAQDQPRACRSVHLWFKPDQGSEATAFYNEIAVEKSAPGTYFMACGFSKGYFGMQELANGKKVVLFSVWEPGAQNNPNATPDERRVKEIAAGQNVRVKRFGGEGTGGQSFYDYDWNVGQTCRFVVYAKPDGDRTQYAGYFYVAEESRWQHLATFSTLADKQLLRGFYSFVEDFRRNGESATIARRCQFGNGWANIDGKWQALLNGRFTADQTPTENIDSGSTYDRFFLATGGATKNENQKLGSGFRLVEAERLAPLDLPDPFGDGSTKDRRLRILSYNIKHGRGNDNKVDLQRAASVIRRLNPDIVALQEIDNGVDRSGKIDEPQVLSESTGLTHHAFGSFFDYGGGQYGMATLSRFPIARETNLRLPEGTEPRTSLVTKIQLDKQNSITLANVHFYRTEQERIAQATALVKHLATIPGDAIIAGDFNSNPDSPVMRLFASDWEIPDKGEDHLTFHSAKPDIEIDFAMTRKGGRYKIEKIDVIDEPVISDHRPLVLEVTAKSKTE